MYQEIQQIKEKVSNIGGDFYYLPDEGTGELIDSFSVTVPSGSGYWYLGQLYPRYNGMVKISSLNNTEGYLIDLYTVNQWFLTGAYNSGASYAISIAQKVLSKENITNGNSLLYTFPRVISTPIEIPVHAGIPIYLYGTANSLQQSFEMRAKKVAK